MRDGNDILLKRDSVIPGKDEAPANYADRLGLFYTSTVTSQHKKKLGQFFTPLEIAYYMASLINTDKENFQKDKIRILDPGCGTAILSCAVIEGLIKNNSIKEIELVCYENDINLVSLAEESISYLKKWLWKRSVKFSSVLFTLDFVLDNSNVFDYNFFIKNKNGNKFDIVISNPPYFKLSKSDIKAKISTSIIHGQPNIYSIFLYISAKLLYIGGQMVFIVPRSFTSGNYFNLFRKRFFEIIKLEHIHLFNSRKENFHRDEVLQETIIIKGISYQDKNNNSLLTISSSLGLKDLNKAEKKKYKYSQVIDLKSEQKILHLPTTESEKNIIDIFKSWKGSLNKYNIQISTGPVVPFRSRKFISDEDKSGKPGFAPLYWMHNTSKMCFTWPVFKLSKAQFIGISEDSKKLLVPNKNYVFLRRFSSKDDKRRLIAAPYFFDFSKYEVIGIENHINYIYRPKGNLDRNEVLGISALLNSDLFDIYFRTFNGNINVSATELRQMPFPPLEKIREIGDMILNENNFTQSKIDEIINDVFSINQFSFNYEQNRRSKTNIKSIRVARRTAE